MNETYKATKHQPLRLVFCFGGKWWIHSNSNSYSTPPDKLRLAWGMVDSICIFAFGKNYSIDQCLHWSKRYATGISHLDGFESHHPKAKRKSTPNGVLFFLTVMNEIDAG